MSLSYKVKLLNDRAQMPRKGTDGAAACDLYAANELPLTIEPGGFAGVPTGIAIELPDASYVALLFSRSGHGAKKGVSLSNSVGVIDSDYRGEVVVSLINHGSEPFTVERGDRIAQLMIVKLAGAEPEEVSELAGSARGEGGFGSTGK